MMCHLSIFVVVDQRRKSDEISRNYVYLRRVRLFRCYKFQLVDTRGRRFAISQHLGKTTKQPAPPFRAKLDCTRRRKRRANERNIIYRAYSKQIRPFVLYVLLSIISTWCASKYVVR